MEGLLSGMRIIEGSAFVAAPLGGLTLTQLGADVIRFDQIGGGIDSARWPVNREGHSLFWAGMNKGKRSICVDLQHPKGRELIEELISAPGPCTGMFLTNFPARGWLAYDNLRRSRRDLIMVALQGDPDGSSQVDYTVNPATGFPLVTGPSNVSEPINSVLPTWDLLLGSMAAIALLAAERRRNVTGLGDLLKIALSDVAFSVVGHLGRIAQAQIGSDEVSRDGNYLYGAFGHNFATKDDRQVMIVALTRRQWEALKRVTGLADSFATIAASLNIDLETEAGRFRSRELITGVLRPWFAAHTLGEVRTLFSGSGVSWGPYQTFTQLINEDPRCSIQNTLFQNVENPNIGSILTPRSPIRSSTVSRPQAASSPTLGQHTDEVLAEVLGLSGAEIGQLHDLGIVAGNSSTLPQAKSSTSSTESGRG